MSCGYTTDCPDPVWKSGFCKYHYNRTRYLQKLGKSEDEVMAWRQHESLEDKLWAQVTKCDDPNCCWIWTGRIVKGHGQVWHEGKHHYVHIVAYELLVGPVPEGMELDHECHNEAALAGLCVADEMTGCIHRACVNPAHLVPKPHKGNILASSLTQASINKAKTECKRGHPFDEENTRIKKGTNWRSCKACDKMTPAERRAWDDGHE